MITTKQLTLSDKCSLSIRKLGICRYVEHFWTQEWYVACLADLINRTMSDQLDSLVRI